MAGAGVNCAKLQMFPLKAGRGGHFHDRQVIAEFAANGIKRKFRWDLTVQSRSVVESAMLMLHSGRPYGTDSSRQRQDHARRPSCYTAIEGFDPRARQPLRS
jgi:hypothetical protein